MQMMIIEIIIGILGGTASGTLIARYSSALGILVSIFNPVRVTTNVLPRASRFDHLCLQTTMTGWLRATNFEGTSEKISPALPISPVILASCPACGLQAPTKLIAEHFLGSPSHQSGAVQRPTEPIGNNLPAQSANLTERDSRDSLRSLLQVIVPPRAFGRRHARITVSPLSRLVRTLEQ